MYNWYNNIGFKPRRRVKWKKVFFCIAVLFLCIIPFNPKQDSLNNGNLNENVEVVLRSSDKNSNEDSDEIPGYYNGNKDAYNKRLKEINDEFKYVLPGDIFYDEIGKPIAFGINTGHVGIVKSVEVHKDGSRVLKIIESNPSDGVQYHDVTAKRFLSVPSQILRVSGLTSLGASNAIKFCEKEIGKKYPDGDWSAKKRISTKEDDTWYCSELVWAAFMCIGKNIEKEHSGPVERQCAISPYEIYISDLTNSVVKSYVRVTMKITSNEHIYEFEDKSKYNEYHKYESGKCKVCNHPYC